MSYFKITTHLSEILEESEKNPLIIFIYSSQCGTSHKLSNELEEKIKDRSISFPIYKVTVQTEPELSRKIEEWFQIKHESPQIIILNQGKVAYTEHHNKIEIENFKYKIA